MLSESEESDTESLHKLTIDEHYARAFEYKKEREELEKLKEKYGSDFDEEEDDSQVDSESDESEDEDGEELTPTVDAAILRTLAKIKRKDPEIYDNSKNIFTEEQEKIVPMAKHDIVSKVKETPVTIRQAAFQSALDPDSRSPSPEPLPHVEEQRVLRNETITAFHEALTEDDVDDLLVLREKTKDEREQEEEEYRAFLEREVGGNLQALVAVEEEIKDDAENALEISGTPAKKEKKKQKRQSAKPAGAAVEKSPGKFKKESDQEFLMNYILNRGWIDRSANHIPTYREVTSSKSAAIGKAKEGTSEVHSTFPGVEDNLPTADSDVDDDFEEIVDRFESSYNFRFEEPDAAALKSYPRQMSSLIRQEDKTRKAARERKKKRQEERILQKKEEIKRLKSLKMKEITTKLERIGKENGKSVEDEALQALDLDGEWNPEAHDRQMADLYGDEIFDDNGKPHWEEDIDIRDIEVAQLSKKAKKKKKKKKSEDEKESVGVDVDAMDADVEEKFVDDEEWDGTEEMRKKKLDEYMDEIYGLDFNDMVGDMPTRFKYIPIQPQNYSLTPVEILMASDQDLNEYINVKKFAPYRKDIKWDSKRNDRLRELKNKLVQKVADNLDVDGQVSGGVNPGKKKRKGKNERMKMKGGVAEGDRGNEEKQTELAVPEDRSQKRRREASEADGMKDGAQIVDRKKKRRRRHQKSTGGGTDG